MGLRSSPTEAASALSPAPFASGHELGRNGVNSAGGAAYSCSTAARRCRITCPILPHPGRRTWRRAHISGTVGRDLDLRDVRRRDRRPGRRRPTSVRDLRGRAAVGAGERASDGRPWRSCERRGTRSTCSRSSPTCGGCAPTPRVGIGQQTMVVRTPAGHAALRLPRLRRRRRRSRPCAASGRRSPSRPATRTCTACRPSGPARSAACRCCSPSGTASGCDAADPLVEHYDERREVPRDCAPPRRRALPRAGGAGVGAGDEGAACCSPATPCSQPRPAHVSFLRSYPNRIPLSGNVVERIAGQLEGLHFDRLYNNFGAERASRRQGGRALLGRPSRRVGARRLRPSHLTRTVHRALAVRRVERRLLVRGRRAGLARLDDPVRIVVARVELLPVVGEDLRPVSRRPCPWWVPAGCSSGPCRPR